MLVLHDMKESSRSPKKEPVGGDIDNENPMQSKASLNPPSFIISQENVLKLPL